MPRWFYMNNLKLLVTLSLLITLNQAVWAYDGQKPMIDWNKLNLTKEQSQAIEDLNAKWLKDYNEIQPSIIEDQRKLSQLLGPHNNDPVEIMSVQQSLAHKREKLKNIAMVNYLKKRQLLNETQRHELDIMVGEVIAQRQNNNSVNVNLVGNDRFQNLIQRVRNFVPANPQR